jgi:putative peptidoglycan lipid II flippase
MKKILLKKESVLSAVFRASLINLFSRGLGYLKNVAIAVLLGFNEQTDAYFLAVSLIGLFLIFVDVFDSLGIPALVQARQKSYKEFLEIAKVLMTFTTFLAFLVLFLALTLKDVVLRIAVGYTPDKLHLLEIHYLALLPYLFFSFFFHHFGAILRSLRYFSLYFVGELLFAFFSFLFIALGLYFYKTGLVLPLSMSFSMFIATVYITLIAKPFLRFGFQWNNTIKSMLKEFFGLILVYGVFHLFTLVDRIFATLLPTKSISALSYGFIISRLPVGLLRIEQIAITSLAEAQARKEKVNFYLKKILLISIPITLFLFFSADLLVKLFFSYGAFSTLDAHLTALATKYYALSLPFVFVWSILYKVFQIRKKLLWIIPIALISVGVNTVLNYLFLIKFNMGLVGICLGTLGAFFSLSLLSYLVFYYRL